MHRVLGAFGIRCLPGLELLYLYHCLWRFRRPFILPILPFVIPRYVTLPPSFIYFVALF